MPHVLPWRRYSRTRNETKDSATLYIEDVDILDGTPLLDIKPYVPQFDHRRVDRIGWLSEKVNDVSMTKADDRFK